jgi:2-oxoglutarate dehydrogenase E2 component (dihydrolipoamide succinyltransferase)
VSFIDPQPRPKTDVVLSSNGGVFGSLYGTPIINLPQSAVLGMHAIKDRPVVVNGQIVIRPIMVVALTYDHRLLDGREAVTFLGPYLLLSILT